ncbi:MAG: SDR family NAD(P)-dependent oxidoreductase [Proteobacteria bacterium]|nr:SDR family NAD(P)-dependent oxidoreductase [Pseudomonadota bacterium]
MAKKQLPKRALITGAASGIGRALARECASRGMHIVGVDLNEAGLNQTADEIRTEFNVEVHTFVIDLSQRDAPERCLAFCDENGLEIDLLINNAGVFFFAPLTDADPKRVAIMCDLHVYCVTRMCVLFAERMKQRRFGYIMNQSSMSAWMAMPGISTYNATKAYVRSMSRSLHFELKPWNVSVTAVCPGGANTPLLPISDKIRKLGCSLGFLSDTSWLAKKAINATLKGKIQTIPGIMNHFYTFIIMTLPNWLVSFIMNRLPMFKACHPPKDT